MHILFWVAIGLIAGAIAYRVLDSRGGFFGSLVVGLLGALIGGELASLLKLNVTGGFIDQLVVAIIGAILFLFIWRRIKS